MIAFTRTCGYYIDLRPYSAMQHSLRNRLGVLDCSSEVWVLFTELALTPCQYIKQTFKSSLITFCFEFRLSEGGLRGKSLTDWITYQKYFMPTAFSPVAYMCPFLV